MLTRRDAAAEIDDRPFNNLLRRLNRADFALIEPHLTRIAAEPSELLYDPGANVETILVGREGAVGGIVSQGFLPAYTRISVKFGGPIARLAIGRLEASKARSPTLRNVFARYADCMLAQIFQSTACNAIRSSSARRNGSSRRCSAPMAAMPYR